MRHSQYIVCALRRLPPVCLSTHICLCVRIASSVLPSPSWLKIRGRLKQQGYIWWGSTNINRTLLCPPPPNSRRDVHGNRTCDMKPDGQRIDTARKQHHNHLLTKAAWGAAAMTPLAHPGR